MREFILPVMAGAAVAFAWLALWAICLHAFGLTVLTRSPEKSAARKGRILAMGKWRYVLIFGVLGSGLGLGLGLVVATNIPTMPHVGGWIRVATQLVLCTVVFGLWKGITTWNEEFRGEVPFPPPYPGQK